MLILSVTEKVDYLELLFETVSAIGNAGLSMGITATLTPAAKIVLSLTMFIGRVGPLTMGFFLVGQQKPVLFRYAQADVFVGVKAGCYGHIKARSQKLTF